MTNALCRVRRLQLAALLGILGAASGTQAADAPVDFAAEVLPILSDKCFACHGPDAGEVTTLRLDSWEAATADLGGYRAIDPQELAASEILARITSTDDPMPPADADKQLSSAERDVLRRWILHGGKYAQHWAFVPPQRRLPPGQTELSVDEAIDAFVGMRLQERGLEFAPPADRSTLGRRAALSLTGLPPEPAQLTAFLADERPDAYERYVDELLASPRYGEHLARYWLDAVRYGDTHGLHLDNRRGIHPYRDFVVRAFNRNLPLDDFIVWQLAGDLLRDPTLEQLVATGFVRLNPSTSEGGAIPEEFQAKNNFDRTETLGSALLGMTLTCARCHTHKYDPITHVEYYRLLAFFNSTAEPALDGNSYDYGPVVRVPADQPAWEAWEAASARTAAGESADATGLAALEEKFVTTLVARDLSEPRPTFLLKRGEYDLAEGEPLSPDVPEALGTLSGDAPRNRLGLAQWLTSPENPLVARVLVNRLWASMFGDGLVRTPEDFGLQGQQPTHPLLLDWLAVELRESGWDMRHILRLMATSRTFRQESKLRTDVDDPENRLWARGPNYRLDAEVLRDMALWASGLLDPHMGGEGVKPYQPPGMWLAMAHPASNTKEYVRDTGSRLYRRSLYVYWKRTSPHPMMTLFDAPDRESSCVRRSRSSTPLQSLALLNETQRIEMARKLAERLVQAHEQDEQRLATLFGWITCRAPLPRQHAACVALLANLRSRYAAAPDDAIELLAVGDAERDASLDPVEVAAWTQVAATVLASDAALLMY